MCIAHTKPFEVFNCQEPLAKDSWTCSLFYEGKGNLEISSPFVRQNGLL